MIQDQLDNGKQILYLVPEIALTSQIINRLKYILETRLVFLILE